MKKFCRKAVAVVYQSRISTFSCPLGLRLLRSILYQRFQIYFPDPLDYHTFLIVLVDAVNAELSIVVAETFSDH